MGFGCMLGFVGGCVCCLSLLYVATVLRVSLGFVWFGLVVGFV